MKRRKFIALVGIAVLLPCSVGAQQPGKVTRIGVLTGAVSEKAPNAETFRESLRRLGYAEGGNIAIEWRWAGGDVGRIEELAQELVQLGVDVIVANSNAPIRAVQRATKTIPIVMVYPSDPVALGFIASLARPGGNTTGLTSQAPELDGKRLELIKEAVPNLSRTSILWDSNQPGSRQRIKEIEQAGAVLGLPLHFLDARNPEEFGSAFAAMVGEGAGAVVYSLSPMQFEHRARIAEHALKNRLPTICATREYVEAGCLMGYSASWTDLWRRAAHFVDKILKGVKPADLPVEQPISFELVINLKTAKALGLAIPPTLLARADEVIE